MEKHCVSLELAKQVKEAGFKKETEFWWIYNKLRDEHKICYGLSDCCKNHPESWEYYSAPLATEILEELPVSINSLHHFRIRKTYDNNYITGYQNLSYTTSTEWLREEIDKNLCNALAKMWLYLKKEKLL